MTTKPYDIRKTFAVSHVSEKGKFDYKKQNFVSTITHRSFEHLLFLHEMRVEDFEQTSYEEDFELFPKFQRDHVWTLEQKQQLIISILNDIPIGAFYVNKIVITKTENSGEVDHDKTYLLDNIIYDGQQRYTAILEFLQGKFSIDYNGQTGTIADFGWPMLLEIKRYGISVIETNFDSMNDLIDYYVLINSGGTVHTKDELEKALSYKSEEN